MVDKRVFILGAGMSGLVAGYEFLKKGVPVTIIEKFEVPGGLAKTIRYEDYYIDSGPHLFHTSNPEIIEYWKELFSDIFTMPSLYGKNYVEGKYFDYPLTEKTLEQLPNELVKTIKSEMSSINKDELSAAKNYHEYMEALAGPTLQKMFYEEYPEKLWGIPTKELSPNWAPQRIEIRKENKPFHSDQWSAVARNGCGHPFEVLAEKIKKLGGKILYSEEVLDINYDNNRANKIITDKQEIELKEDDIIVSTLPITKNSQFFDVDCSLSFRNIILVNLILKDTDPFPDDADWLYFKDKEVIFHRAGLQTRFSKSGIPDGWSILCCEIAYTVGDSISEMSEEEISNKVIEDIVNLGFVERKQILRTHTSDLGPLYPSYRVGFEMELQKVVSKLEKTENFYFSGTLADFSYADFQVLCAKAIDLVEMIENTGSSFNRVQRMKTKITNFNQVIDIAETSIGENFRPYIIGEIGICHNGSIEIAKRLIDMCSEAGCNSVKFQTFSPGRVSGEVLDARYHEDIHSLEENLSELFDRLIFSYEETESLFSYAKSKKIDVFSTPFDIESVEILESLDVPAYKIASMDLVNLPLIRRVAQTMKPVIISTGMSTLGDIEEAVNILKEEGNPNLILLHCVSSYPASFEESNLRVIKKLADTFGVITGFSDHFEDIFLVPAAISLGARVIEKHVTLDRAMKGPDHVFSLEEEKLKSLVIQSDAVYQALGSGIKTVSSSEYQTIQKLRRSIFVNCDIQKGSILTKEMITIKSPGIGILPKYIDLVVGRSLKEDLKKDHPLTWEVI